MCACKLISVDFCFVEFLINGTVTFIRTIMRKNDTLEELNILYEIYSPRSSCLMLT